jgi:hypothetical protein
MCFIVNSFRELNFKISIKGPGTIVGSAAFNLLVISAICVIAIDSPKVSRIKNFKGIINLSFKLIHDLERFFFYL